MTSPTPRPCTPSSTGSSTPWPSKLPDVAAHLDAARADVLAFTAFPKETLAADLVEQPGAPRGAVCPSGGERPAVGLSQQPGEAGGSLIPEVRVRVGAALTTTGRVGTARRPGSGKRDGEVYECRNQWWNPLKWNRLEPGGCGPGSSARATSKCGGRLRSGHGLAGPEATVKGCGVAVARLQGKSWAPIPSTGTW